ncbi:hypothetical protein DFH07DRAFT_943613 [Mycena maculata]|uniref:Uncharacterized protein n=1 Tax=Mycena maculata TaxID=230809 RepID=A0AAD7N281_9AGAR|nr:hypothetical protein DFH07DRAFT_943613 [Mycena maculata]
MEFNPARMRQVNQRQSVHEELGATASGWLVTQTGAVAAVWVWVWAPARAYAGRDDPQYSGKRHAPSGCRTHDLEEEERGAGRDGSGECRAGGTSERLSGTTEDLISGSMGTTKGTQVESALNPFRGTRKQLLCGSICMLVVQLRCRSPQSKRHGAGSSGSCAARRKIVFKRSAGKYLADDASEEENWFGVCTKFDSDTGSGGECSAAFGVYAWPWPGRWNRARACSVLVDNRLKNSRRGCPVISHYDCSSPWPLAI